MRFSGGSEGKESACNARDLGLILSREDPLENGNPLQKNLINGGGVAKSQT